MGIKKDIKNALHAAMVAGDKSSKNALRLALSSIKLAEVEKGEPIEDLRILNIIQKEIKTREETINEALKADRKDMIQPLENEIKVLKAFLPVEITDDELESIVINVVAELQASTIKQMGIVMKSVIEKVQGGAANDRISKIVKRILSS
jgi:uncharacterized protein YqeY